MEEFVLRELTKSEHEKLDSFIADESTELYQYFLAIITTDLIPEGEVSWERALEKIIEGHTRELPYSICGVIDAWIRLCMEYKSYGLVDTLDQRQIRGLRRNMDVVVNGFVNCIYYYVSIGGTGKKQSDLEKNYTMIVMKGLPKWTDEHVDADPELMYRFILTYLEKLGFHLKMQNDNTRHINLEMFRGVAFE